MPLYIGDGVYVDTDQMGRAVLTTADGVRVTNTIVLEPEVIGEFIHWLARNSTVTLCPWCGRSVEEPGEVA